jgi:hypothetical protein
MDNSRRGACSEFVYSTDSGKASANAAKRCTLLLSSLESRVECGVRRFDARCPTGRRDAAKHRRLGADEVRALELMLLELLEEARSPRA